MKNRLVIAMRKSVDTGTHVPDAGYEIQTSEGKKKRYLNDRLEVVEVSPQSEKGVKFDLSMNSKNLWRVEIIIPETYSDLDKLKKWAAEHPQLAKTTDANAGTLYVYEFSDEAITETYDDDDARLEAAAKFKSLSLEEKQTVAVNFGISPWELEEKELVNRMVGLSKGLVTNTASFRNEFLNNFDRMITDETRLNFKSGVQSNVIQHTSDGVYTIAGEVIGATEDNAVLTLRQRSDLYSILTRELVAKGRFITTHKKIQETKAAIAQEKKEEELEDELEEMGVSIQPKGKGGRPPKA